MRVLHRTFLRGLAGAARLCLMSLALVAVLALAVTAVAPAAAAAASVCVENASIEDPQAALAAGRATAADVARACAARIEAYDRAGPRLDAFAIAEAIDVRKGEMRRPLEGIAVLLKDDATRDLKRPADYTRALDRDGIPIDPDDRAGDIYCQSLSPRAAAVMRNIMAVLEAGGATLMRAAAREELEEGTAVAPGGAWSRITASCRRFQLIIATFTEEPAQWRPVCARDLSLPAPAWVCLPVRWQTG